MKYKRKIFKNGNPRSIIELDPRLDKALKKTKLSKNIGIESVGKAAVQEREQSSKI